VRDFFQYKTYVFDCDGVLLNSNFIKTKAFHAVGLQYGIAAADSLVEYHVKNGGISRYKKFEYFVNNILDKEPKRIEIDRLLKEFGDIVCRELMRCQMVEGLIDLKSQTRDGKWMVVSGGDQKELRSIFKSRNIKDLFDGGVFGSPDSKKEILAREISLGNILKPAVFLGDTMHDYEVAISFEFDFIFIFEWSEFVSWKDFFKGKNIRYAKNLAGIQDGLSELP
jgi:phosphoglycolate phosphatase-like HAD superfamily hydrolase